MKILIGHNHYQQPGGEDAVFQSEVQMLKKCGHEVYAYEKSNADVEKDFFLKTRQLFSLRWSKKTYDEVRGIIRDFRPAIAHFHNTFFMMTPSVYDACREEGVAVVQSLHNFRLVCMNALFLRNGRICELCHPKSHASGIRHRCYRRSFLLSAFLADMIGYHWRRGIWEKKVDRFIVATEFTRKQFIRIGLPAHKVDVKPHFVDGAVDVRQKIDGGYALYVGRLSGEKGIKVLLDAWAGLQEIPLYIAGSGPLAPYLQGRIGRGELKHVQAMGFLDKNRYEQVFNSASVLIVPSVCYENFPRVVVEAYARGIPVVASRTGSLQEIVHEGETGALFIPSDIEDLRRCVRAVWKNAHYLELGRNARKEYERKYTPNVNVERLMAIYKNVLSQS